MEVKSSSCWIWHSRLGCVSYTVIFMFQSAATRTAPSGERRTHQTTLVCSHLASSPGEVPPAGPGPWAFASYRQTYPLAVFVVWPEPMARSDESADRCTDHTESSAHAK